MENRVPLAMTVVLALLALTTGVSAHQALSPAELDTLNYTQVYFQWPPISGADHYTLQVAANVPYDPFTTALVHESREDYSAAFVTANLEWGTGYKWRYIGLDAEDGALDTSLVHQFSIMAFPDSLPVIEVTYDDLEAVQPGLTVLSYGDYNAGVDLEGNVVLLIGGGDPDLLPNGRFLSTVGSRGAPKNITERDINDEVIIETPPVNQHHEVDKLPNGNYLFLSRVYQDIKDPFNPDTIKTWEGDIVIEMTAEGDTVWSWDTFDNFDTTDFDTTAWEKDIDEAVFDWTHGNACHLTADGEAMIISLRHLSRLTLISYPQGDVIWNMGKQFVSDDVDFGQNLNFSYQHEPEIEPDGNILLYDNHNLGPEDSSRALEIALDVDEGTTEIAWEAWIDTLSSSGGDADRLPNGNTLTANTRLAKIIEFDADANEVWRLTKDEGRFYRADRVPDLYPLAYDIKGPDDEDHIPANESFFQFTIANIGHHEQTFRYIVTDSEGWFDHDGWVQVDGRSILVRTVYGMAAADIATDTVHVAIYPLRDPSKADEWTAVLVSDPDLTVADAPAPPDRWLVLSSYPNPFNAHTGVSFNLPTAGPVRLAVYDPAGRLVKTLFSGVLPAGHHETVWRGTDATGRSVGSGAYICVLTTGNSRAVGRMTLLR